MKLNRNKLANDRLSEFGIDSYTDLTFYHLKKELAELHEEINNLPTLLFETD